MVILKVTSKLIEHKKTYSKLMHSHLTPQIPTSPLLPLASPWESIIISLQFMNFYDFWVGGGLRALRREPTLFLKAKASDDAELLQT
jgi:hypothetical protein